MAYHLKQVVWETTYLCNMRCMHCGSGCGIPLKDELTTDEALKLCDDLGKLKPELLTLSGGEPFMRRDWHIIAKRLRDNGIKVNCISNGWYIDAELIKKAKESGIVNIGVSIDGLEDTHDFIRMKGSFKRALSALELMKFNNMPTVACTTVNKRNMKELSSLKNILVEKGVERWQFQIGMPMGNLLKSPELVLTPEELEELVNFCHEAMKEDVITVDLADCIGYYSSKDVELRKQSHKDYDGIWRGCCAGKQVVGIRANGDVAGCLSIRDDNYIEGNIRDMSLVDLWTRPGAFAWNRDMDKSKLTHFCATCQYGSVCLGGCAGSKITMHNCTTHNEYCLFRVAVNREMKNAETINDVDELISKARELISSEDYQISSVYLQRALKLQPDDVEVLKLLGYVYYFMGDYHTSKQFNERILGTYPSDSYALSGCGLCLEKLGDVESAIRHLELAVEFAPKGFTDPYHDLAIVLNSHNRSSRIHNKTEPSDSCREERR